ncbi:PorT family protein [Robertkochia marina]|uniref:PorT family protein n=1 Tax=Robertkochia marina TaxID=1227945 RepID=A0A4S3M0Y7_9FLAO|nr:porin family protein [Robertkochia marina]THD66623.1 PorT family protein [Robertkochia marina]TRZ45539.1 PorT family protein [Robertkochia marina]
MMNSKNLLVLAVAILCGATLHAQSLKLGVKGGVNFSSLNVDPALDYSNPDSRLGVHLGVFGQLGIADQLIFQPELFFQQEGAKFEDNEEIERAKLGYITFGAGLKYEILDKINLMLIPQIGFLSGGEFEEEDTIENVTEAIGSSEVVKGTNIALGFGGGYTFDSGLEISARYNFGLTDTNDDPLEEGFFDPGQSVKTRSLMLSVGYIFGL